MNQKNIDIFNDTLLFIKENTTLSNLVKKTIDNTILYKEDIYPVINQKEDKLGEVLVTKNRSFDAAIKLHQKYPSKRIGVLNFASATNPGGGVAHGSSAQEESLCRISTLFPALNTSYLLANYYQINRRRQDNIHTDDVIYTPNIIICKTDNKNPIRLEEKEFLSVDVLNAAAPNLREKPNNMYNQDCPNQIRVSDEELFAIHLKRARHVLHIARYHNIDILVLGAFGCGAFKNNPYVVAKAYKEILKDFKNQFDIIEFAIYCNEFDQSNYTIFKKILE